MTNVNHPGEPDNTEPSRRALIAALAAVPAAACSLENYGCQ
jgi:hypothetical protein